MPLKPERRILNLQDLHLLQRVNLLKEMQEHGISSLDHPREEERCGEPAGRKPCFHVHTNVGDEECERCKGKQDPKPSSGRSDYRYEEGWGPLKEEEPCEGDCGREHNSDHILAHGGWGPRRYGGIDQYFSHLRGSRLEEEDMDRMAAAGGSFGARCCRPSPCPVVELLPRYCDELYDKGNTIDGSYVITTGASKVRVYCEFQEHGPYNWLVSSY